MSTIRVRAFCLATVIFLAILMGVGGLSKTVSYYDNAGEVYVLTYHNFSDLEHSITISKDRFESHIVSLKENGFKFLTPIEFEQYMQKNYVPKTKSVLITIDDGYDGVYNIAMEILQKHNVPALIFLITSKIDINNQNHHELKKIDISKILEMKKKCRCYFAGHTYNSHKLIDGQKSEFVNLKNNEYFKEFERRFIIDVIKMKRDIYSIGGLSKHFAYPYGQRNLYTDTKLKKIGYKFLYGTEEGLVYPNDEIIKRVDVGNINYDGIAVIEKMEEIKNDYAKTN